MIKDLSVSAVHRVQERLNRVKMQEPAAGGGKHRKRNADLHADSDEYKV